MGVYGKVWECMGKYGKVWESMGKYGKVGESMGKYGKVWESMGGGQNRRQEFFSQILPKSYILHAYYSPLATA